MSKVKVIAMRLQDADDTNDNLPSWAFIFNPYIDKIKNDFVDVFHKVQTPEMESINFSWRGKITWGMAGIIPHPDEFDIYCSGETDELLEWFDENRESAWDSIPMVRDNGMVSEHCVVSGAGIYFIATERFSVQDVWTHTYTWEQFADILNEKNLVDFS